MIGLISGFAAIAMYLGGFMQHLWQLRKDPQINLRSLQLVGGIAILLHGLAMSSLLFVDNGLDLSLLKIVGLMALTITTLVFISGLKKPLHSLFLAVMPISALSLLAALISPSTKAVAQMSVTMQCHVLLSVLAYSLLAIAALQALLSGYQNWQLKHKRQNMLMRTLPPMQTMEVLLFEAIWAGWLFLTLSLISGFLFLNDLFGQHLAHKVTFGVVAWSVYAILLWGRHRLGWRGHQAIRWSWVGFSAIFLGYIGTKVVLEFILS
tara:strand:+ start:117 stop:911 length:795 start_codon:yes stop_codon:yes gene_type:complete